MSTIASLGTLNTLSTVRLSNSPLSVTVASPTVSGSSTASTLVTLQSSSANADSLTYTNPALPTTTWESNSGDSISVLMAKNTQSSTLSGRFKGLGAALLERFKTDGGDFSQSVMQSPLGGPQDASLIQTAQQVLHAAADNRITLNVVTRSGANVAVTLDSADDGGLATQIKVTNGTLSDDERKALASLADGFQQAIDGLSGDTPTLDLGGLTQFDSKTISSVDLRAALETTNGKTQTIDFHADARQRSLSAHMLTGNVDVSVDTSQLTQLGSSSQQTQAINAYLKQFDDAQARGHGDATLMALFKDAFREMVTTSGAADTPTNDRVTLGDTARSLLTGLPDFSASINQAPKSINPMRPGELDRFSYQVSQQTEIRGSGQTDYSVTQRQQSQLVASYHTTLSGANGPLMLTGQKKSQNYRYYEIEDTASSQVQFAYSQGKLIQAMLIQAVSQTTHMTKYVLGNVDEDTTTPLQAAWSRDLLDALGYADSKSPQDAMRQRSLGDISKQVLLQSNPALLNAPSAN